MRRMRADQSTGEWFQVFNLLSPLPSVHPPSLKNPQKVPIPMAQDGWKRGASKQQRAQAMQDLVEIHKRLRRQFGKPEITHGAHYPIFPNMYEKTI